jgi:hypothetical protein
MAKTDINNFALVADKAVGSNFLNTEFNAIVSFLLAVKEYKGAYQSLQDLDPADTPTFKNIKITDAATISVADKFIILSGTTGEMLIKTAEQFMEGCGIPQMRAAKATIIAGMNDIIFPLAFPNNTYVFSGIVYGGTGGQPETASATAEESYYTTTGCKVYSPIAGTLHYTIIEILD